MLPHYVAITHKHNPVGVYSHLDCAAYFAALNTVAVSVECDQATGGYPGRTLCITIKRSRQIHQIGSLVFINLPHVPMSECWMLVRLCPDNTLALKTFIEFRKIFNLRSRSKKPPPD